MSLTHGFGRPLDSSGGAGRLRWLVLAAAIMFLLYASRLEHDPSTIELFYLRPIDARTRLMAIATALTGLSIGWVAGLFAVERTDLSSRPLWTAFAACLFILTSILGTGGISLRTAALLALLCAVEAATVIAFMTALVTRRRGIAVSLAIVAGLSIVPLLAMSDTALSFVGILLPTFWIGDMLSAVQLGQESRSSGAVALTLHGLPLAVGLGLRAMARDERA